MKERPYLSSTVVFLCEIFFTRFRWNINLLMNLYFQGGFFPVKVIIKKNFTSSAPENEIRAP